MKKQNRKKLFTALFCAFAVSAAFGACSMNNETGEENDVNELDSVFSSLQLSDGAIMRYDDEEKGSVSWSLTMDKTAYEALKANSFYTNVTYGLLVAPESYYEEHAFDTQENIDSYYSVNEESEGKSFLYETHASELSEDGTSSVSLRNPRINMQTEDLIVDYRAVGYVSYLAGDQEEKHFFVNDKTVCCAVEIAELAVETLDETKDAKKIKNLNEDFIAPAIDSVTWGVETRAYPDAIWYSSYGLYCFGDRDKAGIPVATWDKSGNRWVDGKYEASYRFIKGDFSYEYGYDTSLFDGIYTLEGTTRCAVTDITVKSYTRQITFISLQVMPLFYSGTDSKYGVNGYEIGSGVSPYDNATGLGERTVSWDEKEQTYSWTSSGGSRYRYGYGKKATGDFIADFTLEYEKNGNNRHEFRIWTSEATFIAIDANDTNASECHGNDTVYLYNQKGWGSEIRLYGNEYAFINLNHAGSGALSFRVVNYKNTLYFFGNTYKSLEGSVLWGNDYNLLMSVSSKQTLKLYNNMSKSDRGFQYGVGDFFNAARKNEFAFGFVGNSGNDEAQRKYATIALEDDDSEVAAFMAGYLA